MPINAHPDYLNAEAEYHNASTDKDKLLALEKMVKFMPKHKSAEALRKNIRTRYKKLKQEISKKKKGKSSQKGIRKAELQAVIIGLTNSGKSSLLKVLTNAQPRIASYGFTTTHPEIGTLNYEGCNIQLIDMPPIASENFNIGLLNTTDLILIVVEKIHEIQEVLSLIKQTKTSAKKIIVFNKIDLYSDEIKRKISETLKSKKYNFVLISCSTREGLDSLKEKILNSFDIIRVYTKQPGKNHDDKPVILPLNSSLKDVAEKVLRGYSKKVKKTKIWGPSSKFSGQEIGLNHIVKDKDIVEFYTE